MMFLAELTCAGLWVTLDGMPRFLAGMAGVIFVIAGFARGVEAMERTTMIGMFTDRRVQRATFFLTVCGLIMVFFG